MMSDLHDLLARHRAVAASGDEWFANNVAATGDVTIRTRDGNRPIARVLLVDRQTEENGFPIDETRADAAHIALNDPEVALALNAVAETLASVHVSHFFSDEIGDCIGLPDCPGCRKTVALTQLHEVMQRKMGDGG